MAAFDYSGFAATALALIERFGTTVYLLQRQITGPKHSPTVGWSDPLPILGVLSNYKAHQIDGENITARDRKVILASDQQEPQIEDRLRIGSTDFEIVNVAPVRPATTTLLYNVQVRA